MSSVAFIGHLAIKGMQTEQDSGGPWGLRWLSLNYCERYPLALPVR